MILSDLFWICLACLLYTYALFPALVLLLGAASPGRNCMVWKGGGPTVSVIFTFVSDRESSLEVATHVRERIQDLRQNRYPGASLQIVGVSDGPFPELQALEKELGTESDTGEVVLIEMPDRPGKTASQNAAVKKTTGEVLIFTDADTRFEPGAIESLADALADPGVGVACGRLRYASAGMEAVYWAYEMTLKRAESRIYSLMGANGAIYALRRRDYAELPSWAQSDLVEPIYQLLNGRRTVLVDQAVAVESVAATGDSTFNRKRRITLRALGSLMLILPVLNIKTRPLTAWIFISHKLLRWFSWIPFLILYFLAFFFSREVLYARFGLALLAFCIYGLGVYCGMPGARLPAYIVEVATAQMVATLQWLFGRREIIWHPTGIPLRQRGRAAPG